jgi:hypothetical protein
VSQLSPAKYLNIVIILICREESLSTQLDAFKSIVMLTTRYPYLRHFFITCKHINRVGNSHNAISSLWMRAEGNDEDSVFMLKYAAFCVSDNAIAIQVEKIDPVRLGCVRKRQLSVVEKLSMYCR